MDVGELRRRTGLSREDFVRKLAKEMTGLHLNVSLLTRIENREIEMPGRVQAIEDAARKVFPDLFQSDEVLTRTPDKPWNWRFFSIVAGLLAIVAFAVGFFLFGDHEYWQKFEKFLGALATIASIIGFVVGLGIWKRRL